MKLAVVPIGNSRGIRLPKAVLDQCGITDAVEVTIEGGRLVMVPFADPRDGWEEAFGKASAVDDAAIWPETSTSDFDEQEWTW
ncbi:MAG: AbrB/MazE/SpoVT family DNA-binding domain-containing protein [Rhizobiales bacterium]|nr:AbrB/MazE/SpoVT family DNA-binding domain-containing protein [Hyphomicrobiales bacterium]